LPVGRQRRIQVALGALHLAQVVADAHGEKASEELGAAFYRTQDLRGLGAYAADRFVGRPQLGEHLGQAALGWPEPAGQPVRHRPVPAHEGAHQPVVLAQLGHGLPVIAGHKGEGEAGGGWLHTGDVGVLDADGYLTIVDRIKDMIIRGGVNIYPKEIESVLGRHDAVLEAAVIGVPDEMYGEVPVAYVVTYPEASVTAGDLLALCRGHLIKIKIPVAIHIVPALPKNAVGKTDKPVLRVTR
jgi:acyl-CoA synthetase (AMP-forming)/AMP-acid ligase II